MEIFTGILRKTMANKICGSDEKLKAAEMQKYHKVAPSQILYSMKM